MDGCDEAAVRGADGRFLPGCSGNPEGKRPGTKNRATLLAEALKEGEAALLVRALVDRALAGDAVALRFCVGRLVAPAPRGRAVRLDLPEGVGPGDVVAAFNATLAAMAAGEITPEEALTVTRVLDGRLRALQAWDLERDLTRWGKVIPGDQAMRPQEADAEEEDDDIEDEDDIEEDDEVDEAMTAPPSPSSPAQQAPSPGSAPAAAAAGSGGLSAASLQTILSVLEAEQRRRSRSPARRVGAARRAAAR